MEKHIGSSFDDFLKEEGLYETCTKDAEDKVKRENKNQGDVYEKVDTV